MYLYEREKRKRFNGGVYGFHHPQHTSFQKNVRILLPLLRDLKRNINHNTQSFLDFVPQGKPSLTSKAMPSRRKSKKPRRRGNRETTIDTQPPHSNSFVYETTIEEDLRQQRLRQQQKEQQNKQQQERIQKEAERKRNEEAKEEQEQESIDGLDEEDQQRRQPRQSPIHLEHLYSGGGCTTTTTALRNKPSLFSTNLSSPWFGSLEEQSPRLGPHNRQRIRQTWHSKHLLENLNLNPRAYSFYGKQSLSSLSKRWMEYSLPDGTHCSWDLACKRVLHPSARTLDVAMFDDDDGNNNNNNNNTTQLPTIATPVQGGWGLFRPPRGGVNRVLTLKGYVPISFGFCLFRGSIDSRILYTV